MTNNDENFADPACKGCIYYGGGKTSGWKMCMWWAYNPGRRPCKPGEECTVKVTGRKRRMQTIAW